MSKGEPTPPAVGALPLAGDAPGYVDRVAADSCDWLRDLLQGDVALELQRIVADQLTTDEDLSALVARARPRSTRSASGDEVLDEGGGEDAQGGGLAVGHDAQGIDGRRKGR